jgi:uncharacterized protein YjbI with pentapeptide repeats
VPRAAIGGVADRSSPSTKHDPHEERQVRVTAQRILADHLRYDPPAARRWWQPRHIDPNPRYWPDVRLDLTGAALIDLVLNNCRLGEARFDEATFTGHAGFGTATFTVGARFSGATFTGEARFSGATFTGQAVFEKAIFSRLAQFGYATFSSDAIFSGATFTGNAQFDKATFSGLTGFGRGTFSRDAVFNGAAFSGHTTFGQATFLHHAAFRGATFSGDVVFRGATGLETAEFHDVRATPVTEGVMRDWPPAWTVEAGADGWQTLRLAASPDSGQAADEGG